MKLFMDDSCQTTAKQEDMQTLLNIFKRFVEWTRFKLKSSKLRALVYNGGQVVKWSVEGEIVDMDYRLQLEGEVVPNVYEKPIKFGLGRWIRAEVRDTVIIEETRKDLMLFLDRLDRSELSGMEKCWGYQ